MPSLTAQLKVALEFPIAQSTGCPLMIQSSFALDQDESIADPSVSATKRWISWQLLIHCQGSTYVVSTVPYEEGGIQS
ncbi:MAG: hypothetical protein M0P95_11310 [Sulfuritalea sp.]|jgi:hypothetical protein|nr:hypothetical protein [Sulfuritalea sp.]